MLAQMRPEMESGLLPWRNCVAAKEDTGTEGEFVHSPQSVFLGVAARGSSSAFPNLGSYIVSLTSATRSMFHVSQNAQSRAIGLDGFSNAFRYRH